jgi:predicted ester cyclase
LTVDSLLDEWEAAWSARDVRGFEPVCDPGDFHYEDPLTNEPLESALALGRHAERLWAAFPDARLERTGERLLSEDGRYVAAPCKLLATHKAPLEGLPPTNAFVIVHAVFYCELREQRLHRVRGFFDLYSAAVQLGVLPKPGTLGEKALLMLRGFGWPRAEGEARATRRR